MKYQVLNIRPEFLKNVAGEPSGEAIRRPDHRIVSVGLTIDTPCI
jgi:hypothetical protein